METELDFSKAKRAADVPHLAKLQAAAASGKTRITIMLDNDVLEAFRARADAAGTGYQTAINEALRGFLDRDNAPLTARVLRETLHEEMKAYSVELLAELGRKQLGTTV